MIISRKNNFLKKRKVVSSILNRENEIKISHLIANEKDFKSKLDNFISISTKKGTINFICNFTNPILDNTENYLDFDNFGLYSLYDEILIEHQTIKSNSPASAFKFCFANELDQFFGFSFMLDETNYLFIFGDEEIFFAKEKNKNLESFMAETLMHISREEYKILT